LSPSARRALRVVGREADERGWPVYLVGGTVRDLLLGRDPLDLDVAVEGSAPALAKAVSRRAGVELVSESPFGTASLRFGRPGPDLRVDLASTRAETYPEPAALPEVRPAPIADDLARRDFSVNAMAVRLLRGGKARVIDPFGGRQDLSGRVIRMLHRESPKDDPTRAFRAVRYAIRLGFRIEPATRRWIGEAVRAGAMDRVSGDRLRRELFLLFSEAPVLRAVSILERYGLLRTVSGNHEAGADVRSALGRIRHRPRSVPPQDFATAVLILLAAPLPARFRARFWKRLGSADPLDGRPLSALVARIRALSRRRARASEWSHAVGTLAPAILEAAAAVVAPGDAERLRAMRRLSDRTVLSIRGADLVRAGIAPGPGIGRALQATRRALLDGRISPDEELRFAVAEAAR